MSQKPRQCFLACPGSVQHMLQRLCSHSSSDTHCSRSLTRLVSNRLLLRGATMTLACSSTVKLLQLKSGSM